MKTSKDTNRELRDAVEMWIELAVHKFNAADGVVVMGDCSRESVTEIMELIASECDKARDSEQNTLFSILRHLDVKHDAKSIMRVRREWQASAEANLKSK